VALLRSFRFTTPASTIWYQADCDDNSNRFQPDTSTDRSECLSSAFPVNPYGHNEDQLRSIRDPENLLDLYQNTSVLYESSFVGVYTLPFAACVKLALFPLALTNTAHILVCFFR